MTDLISPTMIHTAPTAMVEVRAMAAIARDNPRNEQLAITRMQNSCGRLRTAEKAFYRLNRDGQQVSGLTVQLARELIRCWGYVNSGITEIARREGYSEMMAEAWDIDGGVRTFSTFTAPHRRNGGNGIRDLVDTQEIFENNASVGARYLRACLLGLLPLWYREEAQDLCLDTLANGADIGQEGPPLAQRQQQVITMFEGLAVTVAQLVRKIGRPETQWTAGDVATLRVIGKSITAGETHVRLEFPVEQTHNDDVLTAVPDTPAPAAVPAAPRTASTAAPKTTKADNK